MSEFTLCFILSHKKKVAENLKTDDNVSENDRKRVSDLEEWEE